MLSAYLMRYVADTRTLRRAFDHLSRKGGQAPGPDGRRYDDFHSTELWDLLKELRKEIRESRYEPGPERTITKSKGPGRGDRILTLQNIEDRVVQRATVEVIQPLLDPLFDSRSFGYRPRRRLTQALATANALAIGEERFIWLTADVRGAFDAVPLERLLDVVRHYLHAEDFVTFLRVVLGLRGTIRIPEDAVMPGPQCDEGPPAASTATPRPRRVKLQHLWLPS